MTVFDARDLTRLASETQSVDAMCDYVVSYRAMLPRRVQRVIDALGVGDHEDALDAVLSLRASSAMVGGVEVTELAQRLKHLLCQGDVPRARATASLLPRAARLLDARLTEFLGDARPAAVTPATPSDIRPHAPCG